MKQKKIRPVVGYYGGKQQQASKLVKMIPKHTVYIEPFGGAASILFAKPIPDVAPSSYNEVINDIDGMLINMYWVIKEDPEKFVKALDKLLYSKKIFDYSRDVLKGKIPSNKFKKAIAYYVNLNMAFGNIIFGGWGRSIEKNNAYTFMNRVEAMEETAKRMRNVHFECESWETCIDRWDGGGSCLVCDPPYISSYCKAYTRGRNGALPEFTTKDYQNLIDRLDQSPGSILLCNYPNDEVTIPDDWKATTYEKIMSATGSGKTMRDPWARSEKAGDFKVTNKRTEVVYFRARKGELTAKQAKLFASKGMDIFI